MMVRELGFEMKAQPSERMKTPEELAREEREKLQKLEVRSQLNTFTSMQTASCYQYGKTLVLTRVSVVWTFSRLTV